MLSMNEFPMSLGAGFPDENVSARIYYIGDVSWRRRAQQGAGWSWMDFAFS